MTLLRMPIIFALVLLAAAPAVAADDYTVKNAAGVTVTMRGKALPGGQMSPANTLVDPATGQTYSTADGLPIQPSIAPVTPIDRGGTITSTNTPITPAMAANLSRKGGWVQADPNNSGMVIISYTGTATSAGGAGNQCALAPGASCPLTINGYVVQTAISVAGTVVGDKFEAVEFQ